MNKPDSDKISGHYMTPQARRRLANAIHGQEVHDLARDILDRCYPAGIHPAVREGIYSDIVRLIEGGADA